MPASGPDLFVWVCFIAGVVYLCEFTAVRVIKPLRVRWQRRQSHPGRFRFWTIARGAAAVSFLAVVGTLFITTLNIRIALAGIMALAFVAGNYADWRGQPKTKDLSILRATYGAGGTSTDVKGRIVPAIKRDRIVMDVTNETMGGDPIYGLVKTLEITYTVGTEQPKTIDVPEGGQLGLP